MNWLTSKKTASVESTATAIAARRAGGSAAAVGLWVVWLRAGRVLRCVRSTRLDIEVPVSIPDDTVPGADVAVVIAVAPNRLAHPVCGRAVVIGDFLAANGFGVRVVHARTLRAGALWTSLRGRPLAGLIPAVSPRARAGAHRPRLVRRGAVGARARLAMAACAAVATLVCAVPATGTPTDGQPGLVPDPPSHGQAGLIAAPPATVTAPNTGPAAPDSAAPGAVAVAVPEPATEQPRPVSVAPQQSVPPRAVQGPSARLFSESVTAQDAAGPELRFGAAVVPAPDWLPTQISDHERAWNTIVVDHASTVLDEAGLAGPATETVLGTGIGGEPASITEELGWVQEMATEPEQWTPLAEQALAPVVAAVEPPAHAVIDAAMAHLPAWCR
ncbi:MULTISPECIES: hypothetical protein [unclassified Nocardia]|uniref:hypothetical protein n=1 Tax=unclassified Nocardia TaxID=2637762 RepID=UPI00278C5431|nr:MULTISPECIES: hypothetical protein [unclassified Nocardia]